ILAVVKGMSIFDAEADLPRHGVFGTRSDGRTDKRLGGAARRAPARIWQSRKRRQRRSERQVIAESAARRDAANGHTARSIEEPATLRIPQPPAKRPLPMAFDRAGAAQALGDGSRNPVERKRGSGKGECP